MFPIFLMNFLFAISTTMGMTFLPLLVTESLGMSLFVYGMVEGSTELVSNILRLVTGNLFDRIKSRRLLFVAPAFLTLLSKCVLFIPNAFTVIIAKITERTANGAFAAPRDAYVGENAQHKGTALGLLNVSKTCGCIIGPLVVSAYTSFIGPLGENIFIIILLACIINSIGLILSFLIDIKKKIQITLKEKFSYSEFRNSFKNLRFVFALSVLFFLGRFNDGVIMLFLKKSGYSENFYLATISIFNAIMLIVSPVMGYMIDKKYDYQVLILTIIALVAFNILFGNFAADSIICACFGLACWGVQRAGAQITFAALIFKKAPKKFYGTAIGIYSLISGASFFVASTISGYLAEMSFQYVFFMSAIFACTSLMLTLYMYKRGEFKSQSKVELT